MDLIWDFIVSVLSSIFAEYLTAALSRLFRALKDGRKGK